MRKGRTGARFKGITDGGKDTSARPLFMLDEAGRWGT